MGAETVRHGCYCIKNNQLTHMASWQLTNALAALLLPPGLLLILLAGGLALYRTRPRAGRVLLAGGLAGLYALSMPVTAHLLLAWWETIPPASTAARAQAIIVLGGGKAHTAPEYGGDTVLGVTLVRLRYAAHLHRRTGEPMLVSGGSPEGSPQTEAETMRRTLEREFAVPVRWVEGGSANTLENARLSYRILAAEGIRTIHLVTHAWHMPRARLAFEHAGFQVIPAATAYTTRYRLTVLDFLPDARALRDSAVFFHEVMGVVWYRLRLFLQG
jgi:uncharacterized SAM-binding protein YcdF (DUF218 family)